MNTALALGSVADVVRGVTFAASDVRSVPVEGAVPILRAGNIGATLDLVHDLVWVDGALVSPDQKLRTGDVAICMSSGSASVVGKSAVLSGPFDGSVGAFCAIVRPRHGLDPSYLGWYLRSPAFWSWRDRAARGVGIQNLKVSELGQLPIPLPPLDEQRRIATRLRERLAEANQLDDLTATASSMADLMRQQAIRTLIPLPATSRWPVKPLDDVATFLDGRRQPVSAAERERRLRGGGARYPYFGANGQAGWIDGFLFDEPLVLLAEDGGAFGSESRPIAYRINGRTWVNNHAHVLRAKAMDVDYLGFALGLRPDVGDLVSGSTRGKLPRSVAGAIPVPVPPLDEQRRIAARLGEQLAEVDRAKAALDTQRKAIDALPAALLREVFGPPGHVAGSSKP